MSSTSLAAGRMAIPASSAQGCVRQQHSPRRPRRPRHRPNSLFRKRWMPRCILGGALKGETGTGTGCSVFFWGGA